MSTPHRHKKELGQNFLIDSRIQHKIIEHCHLSKDDVVVEIGPGQGAISRLIAPRVKRLICIETDSDLIGPLSDEFKETNVEIIHADFLKWDISFVCHFCVGTLKPGVSKGHGNLKVIGNIPYYISTSIIEALIAHRKQIVQAYLTVQLEFGERLAANSGGKEYGALSCFAQLHAKTDILFKISKGAFKPNPKVDSCFVCLDFSQAPQLGIKDEEQLNRLIRTAFSQRRKNILNALSPIYPKEKVAGVLKDLSISTTARPEELKIENFVTIANRLV